MWGTRSPTPRGHCRPRFIPTHVGNTVTPYLAGIMDAVHPHACGEHGRSVVPASCSSGSSPRMWGTPVPDNRGQQADRFIPTHVGNTRGPGLWCPAYAVHPHACGEHMIKPPPLSTLVGSSPRMWGTLRPAPHNPDGRRFIPTHVGNTGRLTTRITSSSVHPHACGEH